MRFVNRIFSGTILPGAIIGVVEIPLLVFYFSGLDLFYIQPGLLTTRVDVPGEALLVLVASLALIIGLLVKEPGRAIKIFTLSQVVGFGFSIIPLFVYPNTTQQELAQAPCCLPLFQEISQLEMFFAGWAILTILLGFVIAGVGSLVGERLASRLHEIK